MAAGDGGCVGGCGNVTVVVGCASRGFVVGVVTQLCCACNCGLVVSVLSLLRLLLIASVLWLLCMIMSIGVLALAYVLVRVMLWVVLLVCWVLVALVFTSMWLQLVIAVA